MRTFSMMAALAYSASAAAVPVTMAHQGRLLDVNGEPREGSVDLVVRLEDDSGWTWSDTFNSTPLSNGYYAVVLGSGTELDAADLGRSGLHVSVALSSGTELGSQALHDVPRAAHAGSVRGRVQLDGMATCDDADDHGVLDYSAGSLRVCTASGWAGVGSQRIGFYSGQARSNTQAQAPLTFSTEVFDDGDGFEPLTGMYTAPVSGTYLFSYNIQFGNGSNSGQYIWCQLDKETAVGSNGWSGANGTDPTYSAFRNDNNNSYRPCVSTKLVKLAQGQRVRLRSGAHSTVNAPVYQPSTFFSGYLLSAD